MGKKRVTKRFLISFLLDRTGSMGSIWDATISGFNEFVQGQLDADYDTTWHVAAFDSEGYDILRDGVDGADMTPLGRDEVTPRALTPLHDSIARTIHDTDKLATDGYDGVIFVIQTDGEENASKEYTLAEINKLITERESQDWQFIFLGANIDAFVVGQKLGVVRGQTVSYSPDAGSVFQTYAVVTNTTDSYAASGQLVSAHADTRTKGKHEKARTKGKHEKEENNE